MLKRCYSESYQKGARSYIGCSVSEEFKSFQSFMDWATKQVGFYEDDFQLDKDILVEGNRIYSSDTCCFVPSHLNVAMIKPSCDLPLGVNLDKSRGTYKSVVGMFGKPVQIGRYKTVEDAFVAYKYFKEAYIKQLAIENQSKLAPKVFDTLVNYEIKHYSCI